MRNGTVVIVDDDRLFVEAISIFLGDHEFRTISAFNGCAGLAWLQYNSADLAIVDVHLPDISGIEVAIKLRLMGIKTPLILTSSDDCATIKEQCHQAGARLFLPKPLAPDVLLAAISETLAQDG